MKKQNKNEDDEMDKKFILLQQQLNKTKITEDNDIKASTKLVFTQDIRRKLRNKEKKKQKEKIQLEYEESPKAEQEDEEPQEQQEQDQNQKDDIKNIDEKISKQMNSITKEKLKTDQIEKKIKETSKQNKSKQPSTWRQKKQNFNWRTFFFMMIISALIILYIYVKINERAIMKALLQTKDLYDILELDPSASQKEIKQQYKKLALIWHPDKNKECGVHCEQKFQMINSAYEILGNEEKRKEYDLSQTSSNFIQSKSTTLTPYSYEHFVINSNKIWIIQKVFSESNPYSQQFSNIWEQLFDQLGHSISFGRINLKDKDQFQWLNKLKISEENMPFLFGYHHEIGFRIAPSDFRNPEKGIKNFLRGFIPDLLIYLDTNNIGNILKDLKTEKKPSIIFLCSESKTPFNLLSLALKFNTYSNSYVNRINVPVQNIQNKLNQTLDTVFLFWEKNKSFSFNIGKQMKMQDLQYFITSFQSLFIYEVYKNSYIDFCQIDKFEQQYFTQNSDNEFERVCIYIYDQQLFQENLDYLHQFLSNKLEANFKRFKKYKKQSLIFLSIGFLNRMNHGKLNDFLLNYEQKNDQTKAIAFLPNQMKFKCYFENQNFHEWIENIEDEIESFHYLNYQLQIEQISDLISNREQSLIDVKQ